MDALSVILLFYEVLLVILYLRIKNKLKENAMSYDFKLKKNIFMYNHLLTVANEQKSYKAIIESTPTKEETMIIWLGDFNPPLDDVDNVKDQITKWFAAQNIKCIFYNGKGR